MGGGAGFEYAREGQHEDTGGGSSSRPPSSSPTSIYVVYLYIICTSRYAHVDVYMYPCHRATRAEGVCYIHTIYIHIDI